MIDEVKSILSGTDYCTVATVSADNLPWSVPVRFAFDDQYLYFRSPVGTTHGANIARSHNISIVVIDTAQATKGAVYLHSTAQKLDGNEEELAVSVFNERFNNPPDQWGETEYYRVRFGSVDQTRSVGPMYYFQGDAA